MSAKPLLRAFLLIALGADAHGQIGGNKEVGTWVSVTAMMVPYCIRIDDLLRKTCARAGTLPLPEKNKKLCELPSVPLEARTARDYADYKAFHRATFADHQAQIAKDVDEARAMFERHYGRMRTGSFTLTELASLKDDATRCETDVQRLLSPALRKK